MHLETPPLPAFQWQEQTTLNEVSIGQPLTLRWSGSEAEGIVAVSASSSDPNGIAVVCRVSGAQNQFTVPGDFMRLLSPGAGTLSVY
jgi:hypothetical protein